MPISYDAAGKQPAVHVIHENSVWTEPLLKALAEKGIPHADWNVATGALQLDQAPPQGVFYNRMSASSHTRGNRYAPEMTAGILAWLEAHGRTVFNGRSALDLEISKLVQYAALNRAGIAFPNTVAARSPNEIVAAFDGLGGGPVVTKHNRAGKGLGVRLFTQKDALAAYAHGADFDPPVDGITLVQRFVEASDKTITRIEFIGRELVYAVRVDASKGFELCPADACEIERDDGTDTCIITRLPFEIVPDFEPTPAAGKLLPRLRRVMDAEGLDVCAFEFIEDAQGTPFVYDINTNTNYNPDAEARAGVSAMGRLAGFLGRALEQGSARATAA